MSEARNTRGRARGWFASVLGLVGVGWVSAYPLAGAGWGFDLASNLLALSPAPVVLALLVAPRGRRAVLGVLVLQVVIVGWMHLRWRAPRSQGPSEPLVVLQANARTGVANARAVLGLIGSTESGLVAITEASAPVLEALRTDEALRASHPYREMPPWDLTHTRVVLSAWPLEPVLVRTDLDRSDPRRALRLVRVAHPDGAFVVLLLHPRSPRSPGRWAEGNAMVALAIETVREMAPGEPLVVLADLNSTPTGVRSRALCAAAGVRRAKPASVLAGTWPASLPWPGRVAIDDAWVSHEWSVQGWKTVPLAGSDHDAVRIELVRDMPDRR